MKFDPDLTIPSQVGDISLTLTGTEASNTKTLTVPKGYRAAAATLPAGIYNANATIGQEIPLLGLEGAPIESSPDYAKVVLVSIPQVPSAPQDLEAVSGDGEVTLTWRAPEKAGTGPVTGYTVCWSTTKPTGENPTSGDTLETKADVTTATVTNLTNGTTYYFWVVATTTPVPEPPVRRRLPSRWRPAEPYRWTARTGSKRRWRMTQSLTLRWSAALPTTTAFPKRKTSP